MKHIKCGPSRLEIHDMNPEELKIILDNHAQWLRDPTTGVRADLRKANLTRANLSGANLRRANLRWANLRGASLVGANLVGANLADADLTGADLADADLRRANLARADLRKANLTGAVSPAGTKAAEGSLVVVCAQKGACTDALLWLWELAPETTAEQTLVVARKDWAKWWYAN